MHSITRQRDVYSVVRCETVRLGITVKVTIFHKLSFATATAVCSYLNGGQEISVALLNVLPMCMPSE